MNPSLIPKTSLGEQLIRQEIKRCGPMDFSRFVELALYHPRYGYYNQKAPRRGRGGDYFTSLQVSNLFPHIFAEAILQMKETLGAEQFSLIEIGSGNGEFLEEVLTYLNNKKGPGQANLKGLKVWAVERSLSARAHLFSRLSRFPKCAVVASLDDIEWMGTLEGCIFSNEFFDALPFQRARLRSGLWKKIFVEVENNQLVEREGPEEVAGRDFPVNDGHEIEIRPQIADVYKEWGAWLSRGYAVTVDYGHPRESFYSPSRSQGTWRGFYKHQATQRLFENIGEQDLTAHVDFTQLVEAGRAFGFDPALFCSQGIFLSYIGQKYIETYLSSAPEDEKRKRAGVVQQLIHPDAMGEAFWTLIQTKGVDAPPAFAGIPNRMRRLI